MRDRDDQDVARFLQGGTCGFAGDELVNLAGKPPVSPIWACTGTPRPQSATRKQRSENQLILSSISSGGRAAASSARCSGLWIRDRQERLSDLFGLRGATCGNLEHRTRRISSPTCSTIPFGIPMTFGWRFQQRTLCLRSAQSHRENIPKSTRIPNAVGRGFCMSLSTKMG